MDYSLIAKTFDLLQKEGIISNWAIAGGSAALFYVEPFVTFDVDVFIDLKQTGALVSLDKFHSRIRELGHELKGEHIDVKGLAVQIMAPSEGVEAEALAQAKTITRGNQVLRVVQQEHLMAICLAVGRAKDKLRLEMFLDENKYDLNFFEEILKRHGLLDKWRQYQESNS